MQDTQIKLLKSLRDRRARKGLGLELVEKDVVLDQEAGKCPSVKSAQSSTQCSAGAAAEIRERERQLDEKGGLISYLLNTAIEDSHSKWKNHRGARHRVTQ